MSSKDCRISHAVACPRARQAWLRAEVANRRGERCGDAGGAVARAGVDPSVQPVEVRVAGVPRGPQPRHAVGVAQGGQVVDERTESVRCRVGSGTHGEQDAGGAHDQVVVGERDLVAAPSLHRCGTHDVVAQARG
ncbi:hypothetical protein [Streptomyces sp. NPDC048521]|uniref:hypothetical protein n=1 Tax=Streptomyces sp. NPDC048521 TaxID=3365566 RepID=UPI00371154EF